MRSPAIAGLVLAVAAAVLVPARADAYLNPDSGSMLLQALLGGFAGLAVLVRLSWNRIAAALGRRKKGPGGGPESR